MLSRHLCPPLLLLLVGCLTSQQQASVSQGWICSDNCPCCHTEIEGAGQTFSLTQSQYTDIRPTSPSAALILPCTWQGSHRSINCDVTGMTWLGKGSTGQAGIEPWSPALEADTFATRPTRQCSLLTSLSPIKPKNYVRADKSLCKLNFFQIEWKLCKRTDTEALTISHPVAFIEGQGYSEKTLDVDIIKCERNWFINIWTHTHVQAFYFVDWIS